VIPSRRPGAGYYQRHRREARTRPGQQARARAV
jgi:hypothetical protein